MGIRCRTDRAGNGFLGTRSVKPGSNFKPSPYAKSGYMAGVRPALTRQPTAEERRRAQRVLLRMPVLVHVSKNPEPVKGYTHTVSVSGAMIVLPEAFAQGTKFILENPKTQQRVEVNVVRSPQTSQEGSLV